MKNGKINNFLALKKYCAKLEKKNRKIFIIPAIYTEHFPSECPISPQKKQISSSLERDLSFRHCLIE
jgi:hypothetical protein